MASDRKHRTQLGSTVGLTNPTAGRLVAMDARGPSDEPMSREQIQEMWKWVYRSERDRFEAERDEARQQRDELLEAIEAAWPFLPIPRPGDKIQVLYDTAKRIRERNAE